MLDALRRAVRRTDSWLNALTNVGLNSGRNAMLFRASARDYLDDITLEQLYELDGLAARIVRAPCVHALRRGFTVSTGDPAVDTAIKARLDDLDAVNGLRRAWQWARLYGGGGVFIGADDGLDPREPLDESAIKSVRFAVDVDRIELIPQTWETDPLSARFGKPRIYQLVRNATGGGAQNASIHASRIIRFDGVEPTKRRRQTLQGWGDSVLQRVYVDLQQARGAYAAVSGLMHEASQGVFKMKDLMLMMAGDRDDTLKRRMEAMDMSRSVARAILIDADGESYERVEVGSLTGLVEAMDRFTNMVSASSEIPVTVLMGQAPAGLNATGESDIRSWYDAVEAEREAMLRGRAERMVKLLLKSKDGPTGGVEPPGWKVTFPPLWQPTPSENADLRLKTSQADQVDIASGVLMPEEVALSRYRKEGYSTETSIDLEARESALKGGGGAGEGETDGEDGEGPAGAPKGSQATPPDHDAITSIIGKVAAREIPRDAGVQLLAAHVGEKAEAVMGEAGKTFFTAPDPAAVTELDSMRAENAKLKASNQGHKAFTARVIKRAREGGLELGAFTSSAPTETEEGDTLEEGDVVAVPVEGTGEPVTDGRFDAADPQHVAIVFPLAPADARKIALPGGEPADELHLTLVYLGKRDLSSDDAKKIVDTLRAWAVLRKPLPLRIGLPGRFVNSKSPKGDAVYRSVSGVNLMNERLSLVQALERAGFPNGSTHPVWVAHVTTGYVPFGERTAALDTSPVGVTMDRVALWAGERRVEVMLGGAEMASGAADEVE